MLGLLGKSLPICGFYINSCVYTVKQVFGLRYEGPYINSYG